MKAKLGLLLVPVALAVGTAGVVLLPKAHANPVTTPTQPTVLTPSSVDTETPDNAPSKPGATVDPQGGPNQTGDFQSGHKDASVPGQPETPEAPEAGN